jgi:hypothetical protein
MTPRIGRQRTRLLLFLAWFAVLLFLVYVADVPLWLGFIGYVIGAVVIRRYVDTLKPDSLTRAESALPLIARGVLTVVAAAFALLLVVVALGFLITWLAN